MDKIYITKTLIYYFLTKTCVNKEYKNHILLLIVIDTDQIKLINKF